MQKNEHQITQENVVEVLLHALELRDKEAVGHSYRVSNLILTLGLSLGLAERDLMTLRSGALLHDIGKLGIPDFILLKPGPLNELEWEIIKRHPDYGANLIAPIPSLKEIQPIIQYHHERWDGNGYPRKLKGGEIPLLARICAVVEVWDGLSSDQIYRRAWPREKVLEKIQGESGKAFEPTIVDAFARVMRE